MRPLFLFSYLTGKWLFDNTFLTWLNYFSVQLRRRYTYIIVELGAIWHFARSGL
jgi:hypothetical protein